MRGPLEGVRVLELGHVITGPMAGGWLADQGADVVKVEPPTGDLQRKVGPRKGDISAMFQAVNRGKRSISLDLRDAADMEVFWNLADWADVLLHNFRPGAMERLGLGHAAVCARNPRLIYCSISGYGLDGPYAAAPAYDPIIQAACGMTAIQADPRSQQPRLVQTILCDKITGISAAQAITAALYARERTGVGQHVQISMFDASLAFMWPDGMYNYTFLEDPPEAHRELSRDMQLWETADGWIAVSPVQPKEIEATCKALGREDLVGQPGPALVAGLKATLRTLPSAVVIRRMREEHAPVSSPLTREEMLGDPQTLASGAIVEVAGGDLGRLRQARHPIQYSAADDIAITRAPHLDEHGHEVRGMLRDLAKGH